LTDSCSGWIFHCATLNHKRQKSHAHDYIAVTVVAQELIKKRRYLTGEKYAFLTAVLSKLKKKPRTHRALFSAAFFIIKGQGV
jgi:hypothetical protein